MPTNPTKAKIRAAKTPEEKVLIVAQYNARQEIIALMTDAANEIRRILQSAAGRDGKILERHLEQVTGDAGDVIRKRFTDRNDPRGRRVFGAGNLALSPYAEILNRWIAWSTRQVVKASHHVMRRKAPQRVYEWLRTTRTRQAEVVSEASSAVPDELREIAEKLRIFSPNALAQYEPAHTWVDPKGYRLSDRIWRTGEITRQRIDALIAEGIREGKSAVEIANQVEQFLRPDRRPFRTQKPYGQDGSSDAMRLARTEITRANGQAILVAGRMNPYVYAFVWNLSPSHPKTDICDDNALFSPYGVNDPMPQYPAHPHCVTPGQLVTTRKGDVAIEAVRPGDEVLTHKGRFQIVKAQWSKSYSGFVYEIKTDAGYLELTGEHPVRTSRGWVNAKFLQPGDQILYASIGISENLGLGEAKNKPALLSQSSISPLPLDGGGAASRNAVVERVANPSQAHLYYSTVQRVTVREYDGPVYNMEVEADNSYTVNGAAVHNCLCYLTSRVDDPVSVSQDLMRMMDEARGDLLPYLTPAQVDAFTQQLLGQHLAALGAQAEGLTQARAGNVEWLLDLREPVRTVNGIFPPDVGTPGETKESLSKFLKNSDGPLSRAFFEGGFIEIAPDGEYIVVKEKVQAAARNLVAQTMEVHYSREYLIDLARRYAESHGVRNLTDADAAILMNGDYAAQAQAVLRAARIYNVTLTEPQWRRLNQLALNQFLDLASYQKQKRGGMGGGRALFGPEAIRRENERREFIRNVILGE